MLCQWHGRVSTPKGQCNDMFPNCYVSLPTATVSSADDRTFVWIHGMVFSSVRGWFKTFLFSLVPTASNYCQFDERRANELVSCNVGATYGWQDFANYVTTLPWNVSLLPWYRQYAMGQGTPHPNASWDRNAPHIHPPTQMHSGLGPRAVYLRPKGFLVVTNIKILHSDLIAYVGNSVYSCVCRSMLELASA